MALNRRELLALTASSSALGEPHEGVLIALDAQNPPLIYAGPRGQAQGLYAVLLRGLFQALGEPLRLICLPWPRVLAGLERGEHGAGCLVATADRRTRYDFSRPLHVETVRVYARRGRLRLFERIEDLAGLRVGVMRSWSYGEAFDAARRAGRFAIEEVSSDVHNFGKLERDFLDVAVAIEQAGDALLVTGRYPSVRALPNPVTENPTFVAFHKLARQLGLLARLDRQVDRMRRSGEHAQLIARGLMIDRVSGGTAFTPPRKPEPDGR